MSTNRHGLSLPVPVDNHVILVLNGRASLNVTF